MGKLILFRNNYIRTKSKSYELHLFEPETEFKKTTILNMYLTVIIVSVYLFFTDIFIIELFNGLAYSSCPETVYVLLLLLKRSIFQPFLVPLQSILFLAFPGRSQDVP